MQKRILFNAFHMNCVVHQSPGLWVRPEDQMARYTELETWVELARLLERGCFDALFLADVVGIYDVYRDSRDAALTQAAQAPLNDPALLIPAMAYATKHLGFAFTSSILQYHPYIFARLVSTLDHLTKGRIAWNIVTTYLESAARGLGLPGLLPHDERYDAADDYIELCYKLWEGSWQDDAVVKNRQLGIYADPRKVREIHHDGKYYRGHGCHMSEPSPQRTPVLYQAGGSPRGRAFGPTRPGSEVQIHPAPPASPVFAQLFRDPPEIPALMRARCASGSLFWPAICPRTSPASSLDKRGRCSGAIAGRPSSGRSAESPGFTTSDFMVRRVRVC
jgi:long-chain alkane monooxygenase